MNSVTSMKIFGVFYKLCSEEATRKNPRLLAMLSETIVFISDFHDLIHHDQEQKLIQDLQVNMKPNPNYTLSYSHFCQEKRPLFKRI